MLQEVHGVPNQTPRMMPERIHPRIKSRMNLLQTSWCLPLTMSKLSTAYPLDRSFRETASGPANNSRKA